MTTRCDGREVGPLVPALATRLHCTYQYSPARPTSLTRSYYAGWRSGGPRRGPANPYATEPPPVGRGGSVPAPGRRGERSHDGSAGRRPGRRPVRAGAGIHRRAAGRARGAGPRSGGPGPRSGAGPRSGGADRPAADRSGGLRRRAGNAIRLVVRRPRPARLAHDHRGRRPHDRRRLRGEHRQRGGSPADRSGHGRPGAPAPGGADAGARGVRAARAARALAERTGPGPAGDRRGDRLGRRRLPAGRVDRRRRPSRARRSSRRPARS